MKGLKSALQAAASAAAAATSAAAAATSAAVEAASGPRALREYALLQPDRPEARGGLGGLIWQIHLARPKRQGSAAALPLVSVWLIDKRVLLAAASSSSSSSSSGGGVSSPEEGEAALAAARAGAAALARVKHPNVLRVIEPLEETRHLLAFVTEGVWGTAAELLLSPPPPPPPPGSGGGGASSAAFSSARAKEARSVSRLEVLHGLASVSRALSFLHGRGIVHRALGPSAVVLTRSGGWKLAGMDLSVPEADPACQRAGGSFFDFGVSGGGGGGRSGGGTGASFSPADVAAASRPELPYASPELVEASSPLTTATDVFSLGALAASLLSAERAPLFPRGGSPRAHLSAVRALASSPGGLSSTGLPSGGCGGDPAAAACLAPLLALDPSARPRADDVERLPLFSADEALRAIRLLEAMSLPSASVAGSGARDEVDAGGGGGGKLRVLSRVGALLPSLDPRVRELLVLPPLLLEARAAARAGSGSRSDSETLAACLSIILDIARTQGKAEFEASTLPALRAVCANMVSAPSPKRKQQQQQQQGVATEGAGTAAAPAAAPPPPLPPTTAVATPAALALLERAPFLAPRCPPDLLLPLVCRALDTESDSSALSSSSSALSASASADASAASAVARAQELAAAASPSVGASAGPQVSEAQLLPRLHRLALATTAARVRAACFRALGEICAGGSVRAEGGGGGESARSASTPSSFQEQRRAPEPLPREAAVAALASFARAAAVDGSASTADAGIDLASSLASRWGQTLAAQSIIPALSPLLAHGEEVLPDDAFGRVAEAIRGHVAAIQAERARRRRRGGGGGGERGAGGPATARALLPAGATKPAAAAPAPAAAAVAAGAFAASAAPRTQATPHPLFAAPARATKAPPPPAVLLPPPPPPPASVAVGTKRHLFFPPPPAAALAAAAAATAPPWAADRVPSLGLSSDLFGEWSVAEATGGSGGGGGEKAPAAAAAAGMPRVAADDGGGGDAAFDALFAAAALSAKPRQEKQQQQQKVSGSARGAPMRPPPPPPAPPLANGGGSGSTSLI